MPSVCTNTIDSFIHREFLNGQVSACVQAKTRQLFRADRILVRYLWRFYALMFRAWFTTTSETRRKRVLSPAQFSSAAMRILSQKLIFVRGTWHRKTPFIHSIYRARKGVAHKHLINSGKKEEENLPRKVLGLSTWFRIARGMLNNLFRTSNFTPEFFFPLS